MNMITSPQYHSPSVDAQQSRRSDELIELILQNAVDAVRHLLKTSSSSVSFNAADSLGRTPLHFAACTGNSEMISVLLTAGADPNVLDSRGSSPLHLAATANHARVVALLLRAGTNPLQRDAMGKTALHWAQDHLRYVIRRHQSSATASTPNEIDSQIQRDLEGIIEEISAYMKGIGNEQGVEQMNAVQARLATAQSHSDLEDVEKLLGSLTIG